MSTLTTVTGDCHNKGRITTEYTVWCAICELWLTEAMKSKREFGRDLRADGWVLRRKCGWVCPKCRGSK